MPSSLFDLSGKVALVSGAAQGIGRAMALALAECGAHLMLVDLNSAGGEATASEIRSMGRRVAFANCNVSEPDQIRALFAQLDHEFGRIDFLGNVAGEGHLGAPEEIELSAVEQTWRNLVLGRFCMCQEAGRRMLAAGGGSIVNIGSLASITALGRNHIAYSMAMGAVAQMTRELSTEWSGRGVRVNAILPAQVLNPSLEKRIAADPSLKDRFLSGIPAGRLGCPDDIKGLAVFLASDSSSWITGALIPMDGGNLAMNGRLCRQKTQRLNTKTNKQQLLSWYRTMQLIRQCEEQLARCHQRGLVHGACHTYVGEEAIAVGVCAHLRKEDVIFSTHRGHGHALAKGLPPEQLIAELFGRETGCSRGRGGSMHLFAPEIGLMGTSGIVGPCILQAAGAGYSFKLLKKDNVAVAFFGDGAVNNGAFHEGLNMAGIWKLPVLFVCENNQFATEVPFSYAAGNPGVAQRGSSYGIPGIEVDGNDVAAVARVASEAVQRARAGGGPTLIECKTYRTRPHAEGMGDYTYRTREEVAAWRERCPIKQFRISLVADKITTDAELDAIDAEIQAAIAAATTAAEKAPLPSGATATQHVYCEEVQPPLAAEPDAGSRQIGYAAATVEVLDSELARQPGIFVMGEGIGVRGGNFATTTGLFVKYGAERLCDTPICERGFVGLACGAAMTGTRPVIDFMFIDFINDAFGEIVNQIAKMQYMSSGRLRMPVLMRGCVGIGHSAATHHSGSYHSIFSHIPGLRVVMPSTPYDAKGLMTRALRCHDPVLFLEHRELMGTKGTVPAESYEIKFGKARIARAGRDATVVALALMAHRTLAAAEQLAKEGISVEVIDPRTVSPLDTGAILASVAKTGRLLIVDEAFAPCSLGAEIAAQVADAGFNDLDAPIRRLNGAFAPVPYSPPLEKALVPDVADIVRAVKELIAE